MHFEKNGNTLVKRFKDNDDAIFYIREELENGYFVSYTPDFIDWSERVEYIDKRVVATHPTTNNNE